MRLEFTLANWKLKIHLSLCRCAMNCKSKKEHLVGDAVHGIIVSVDKVDNINDKKLIL